MSESRALSTAPAPNNNPVSVFQSTASFEAAQRMAGALVRSDLVPEAYRGQDKMGNALIAMDMANRMGLSPMVVMQNLHIISGRPSWSSAFIISALNSSGMFSPIRFRVSDKGHKKLNVETWTGPKGNRQKVKSVVEVDDKEFVAYAVEKETGEILEGPPVTYEMAILEGWFTKNDSKWKTMPELMGRYRAAAFFGRLYAPHILNGMQTDDEVIDVSDYRDVTPAQGGQAGSTEPKPEGRPTGLHAAMQRGKPAAGEGKVDEPKDTAKPASRGKNKPAAEPKADEGEASTVRDGETGELVEDDSVDEANAADEGGDDQNDDLPFGVDDGDDDDYQPA